MRAGPFALALVIAVPAAAQKAPPGRDVVVPVMAVDLPAGVEPGPDRRQVEVGYEVASDGSVSRCDVVRSSGEPRIDAETCRILRERGRFHPPSSGGGRMTFEWFGAPSLDNPARRGDPLPIEDGDEAPGDQERMAAAREDGSSGWAEIEIDVSDEGVALGCRVVEGSEAMAIARAQCHSYMRNGQFIPASDGAGGRRRGTLRVAVGWSQRITRT